LVKLYFIFQLSNFTQK